jgi:thymidine phosphorylase
MPSALVISKKEKMSEFAAVELIMQKREKGELTTAQIDWLVANYTSGVVADEQMSAMAMAILLNGMSRREIRDLTMAMIASGETLNYDGLAWPTSDKHSTGGVGDKITLPLAPLVAAFGVAVPQLSGRGLGHTGGTLDKLESIKGWRASLTNEEFHKQLAEVGAVICAAGAGLAPADKKLYALRDVTGTVEAIPLIASSIMSKKIAEGTSSLVLDVKVGSGAFMKNIDRARELATVMVQLGQDAGVNTSALLTDMSTPLGLEIGNALEVKESVEVLAGGGPADVVELTVELAREMLRLAGKTDVDVAAALKDGRAMDKWRQMISSQGGDPDAALPTASEHHVVMAPEDGVLTQLDALQVGTASWRLGAGRARKEDPVQFGAGITLHAQLGSTVKAGQPLMTLHTDEAERFERAMEALEGSFKIEAAAIAAPRKILLDRIDG